MPDQLLLDRIAASERLTGLLRWPWDFDVSAPDDVSWFSVRPPDGLRVVAQDGSGGAFALCGDGSGENRPVLYVGSEGEAGVIAATLPEAVRMMIALPYWRDCLKFSGGGRLEEMYRTVPYLERELREEEPALDADREELYAGLGLAPPDSPLDGLHAAVTGYRQALAVVADDGSEFGGLFGAFVVADNPFWSA